jgi:hypothetical protein
MLTLRKLTTRRASNPPRLCVVIGEGDFVPALCRRRPTSKSGKGWSAPLELEPRQTNCVVCRAKLWKLQHAER